jgi:hypothetical protein
VECIKNEHKNCFNIFEKCSKICPNECLTEEHYFTGAALFHENKDLNTQYYFWDSTETFISYEETADMLLIDYFTYIGGLFGLWFGICLERLLDLIVKHTRNSRTKAKLQVQKLSLFIYIFSISILHSINDLIRSLTTYMTEKILSINNRMSKFTNWLSDSLKLVIDLIITHVRICRFKLKLYSKTFFYFIVNSIQLLLVLFLSFIFCSKSMFEIQVMKLLLIIYILFHYILKRFNDLFVMFINYFENNMFRTHNRVESINL